MRLCTERLVIDRLKHTDWKGLQKTLADFEHSAYRIYDAASPIDDGGVKVLAWYYELRCCYFAIRYRNQMIGFITVTGWRTKEIGYALAKAYQHQGLAYEAVRAVMDYYTKERKTKVFVAEAGLKNRPSVRLLERLGFTLVREQETSLRLDQNGKPIRFIKGRFIKVSSDG